MSWLKLLEVWVVQLSMHLPLPTFVVLGEIVEEIISPIPSQAVLLTAGSVAQAQHWPFIGLILLALIAAVAKTAATLIYYFIAEKLEETLIPRFGKYIGVSQADIESLGKKLDKGGPREFVSLLLVRCLPIVPSVPVSIVCGLLKISPKTFVSATLVGNLIRGFLVLLTGYLGLDVVQAFIDGALTWRTSVVLAIFAVLVGFFGWGYYKRYQKA